MASATAVVPEEPGRSLFQPNLWQNTAPLLQDSFGYKRVAKIGPLLLQGISKPFFNSATCVFVFFSKNNNFVYIILNQ